MAIMDVWSERTLKTLLATEELPNKVKTEYGKVMGAMERIGYAGRRLTVETLALIALYAGSLDKELPRRGPGRPKSEPAAPPMPRGGVPV
jgi:hypothetical protein